MGAFRWIFCMQILFFCFCDSSDEVCSKFPYEEKLLEKMIRMEINVEMMEKEMKKTETNINAFLDKTTETLQEFLDDYKKLETNITKKIDEGSEELKDFRTNIKHELDQLKIEIKTHVNESKLEIDAFKANCTDELEIMKNEVKTDIELEKTGVDEFKKKANDDLDQLKGILTTNVQRKIAELDLMQVKLGNPIIAFNVRGPSDLSLSTGESIVYKTVLLNRGDSYDVTTGRFKAPVFGVYHFSVHACATSNYGNNYKFGIVKNGDAVASSSARRGSCGSVNVVVMLDAEDEIWVKCMTGNMNIQDDTYQWNSFVGVLL